MQRDSLQGDASERAAVVGRDELRRILDGILTKENQRFLEEVANAAHLTDSSPLDSNYYLRHRIETIKRIRMTARIDALALAAMVHEDYDAARIWARYACEELHHDRMFYADLARHGVAREAVDTTPPLAATDALEAFLETRTREHGSLVAVAYSTFVEWNSERFSRAAVLKARDAFGADKVAGSLSHCEIDLNEDHCDMMLDVAYRICRPAGSSSLFLQLIADIAALFRRYFQELSAATMLVEGSD